MEYENKIQIDLKPQNTYLRSKLTMVTSELETTKLQYTKLDKYNTIVKGELRQTKKHVEKLYSNIKKLDEQIMTQRPTCDQTSIGYYEGESSKRSKVTKEPDLLIQLPKQ